MIVDFKEEAERFCHLKTKQYNSLKNLKNDRRNVQQKSRTISDPAF